MKNYYYVLREMQVVPGLCSVAWLLPVNTFRQQTQVKKHPIPFDLCYSHCHEKNPQIWVTHEQKKIWLSERSFKYVVLLLIQPWCSAMQPQFEESYRNPCDFHVTLDQHSSQSCAGGSHSVNTTWRTAAMEGTAVIEGTSAKAKLEGSYRNSSAF